MGAFCVKKKTGKQRVVIDCRGSNRHFRPTPHLPMGSGAAWSEMLLEDGQNFFVSLSDIQDFFYCLGIPTELSPYFCFDAMSGTEA